MKKVLFLACLLGLGLGQAFAQSGYRGGGMAKVVISEIMFNSPVGGTLDSMEFVELYNAGTATQNLDDYRIYAGNTAISPALNGIALNPGQYLVIPRDSAFLVNNLGVNSGLIRYNLTSNLNNSSAIIRLSTTSATMATLDSVSYQASYPWYSATNGANISGGGTTGHGASLSRCGFFDDGFLASSWVFSTTSNAYIRQVNGVNVVVRATPGAAEPGCALSFNDRYPLATISALNAQNTNGAVDSFGRAFEVRGVVHTPNFRTGTGVEFALLDANNNGLFVFSSVNVNYTPTLGDSLHVYGTLSFFNGTVQFNPDSIFVAATAQALVTPLVTNLATAANEGKLIEIQNVTINAATWPASPTGAGFTVRAFNGTDSFDIRIASGSYYFSQPYQSGTLTVRGIAGQFDNSSPYTTGFQLRSRIQSDIVGGTPVAPAALPVYSISQINGIDASGVADSLNVRCELRAVVHSQNFRNAGGVSFAFIDYTNTGIWVFKSTNVPGFNAVNRGDSLHVFGRVVQFNGMLQFEPDSITVAGQGDQVTPMDVTNISESTENKLVRLQNLILIDTTTNTAAGRNIRFRSGADTVLVRIVGTIDLINEIVNCDTLNITGIGYQFDNASPFTTGYQLYPRDINDIEERCGVVSVNQVPNFALKLYPNPAQTRLFIESPEAEMQSLRVLNLLGQEVLHVQVNGQNSLFEIELSQWAKGNYFLQVQTNQGTTVRQFSVN